MNLCETTKAPFGWRCTRELGHGGPCAGVRTKEPAYFIEVDQNGCRTCGAGRSWVVIGPNGIGGSTTYLDSDDAQEIADMMNDAFEHGRIKEIINMIKTFAGNFLKVLIFVTATLALVGFVDAIVVLVAFHPLIGVPVAIIAATSFFAGLKTWLEYSD